MSPLPCRINRVCLIFALYNLIDTKLVKGRSGTIFVSADKRGPLKNIDLEKCVLLYVFSQFSQDSWLDPATGLSDEIVSFIDDGNKEG